MGRQYGSAVFLGTGGGITGYADVGFDGEVRGYVRMRSSLNKQKWKRSERFAGSRRAAGLFGVASGHAGRIWSALPAGMRRIGDGGAFNALVGTVRLLMDAADGSVWDWEGLRGLVLGELRMENEELRMENGGLVVSGLDGLVGMLGELGGSSEKYVMGSRITDFGRVFLGAGDRGLPWKEGLAGGDVMRVLRYRVWVHAVEVEGDSWGLCGQRVRSAGLVTEWRAVDGEALRVGYEGLGIPEGDGTWVVFAGVEVSEKRGRHWVRLPYCCSLGVVDVMDGQRIIDNEVSPASEVCWDWIGGSGVVEFKGKRDLGVVGVLGGRMGGIVIAKFFLGISFRSGP